ncbi:DUF300-domain-containing protein [Wallemia mellicola]|nr:DUF300-domain-containing protein [Wallemia mellicola]
MSGGSGSQLPGVLLFLSSLSALVATAISFIGIRTHLGNYRMPLLQRFTVRILVMVPVYSLASLISLFSLDAAYWIDVGRDLYEAFVIYCFFNLLVEYLGGERQLIISLMGRQSTAHMMPVSLFQESMDVSDPYSFLFLKRGILQYAWVKPLLAILTLVLKLTGKYDDGLIAWNTGYTYVQLIYNASICTALYCLAMFWVTVNDDLKAFRPVPKFLSVKGILFATFWQGLLVSFLVAIGAISKLGPYTDPEHISLAIGDILICFEMPFFALLHLFAFSSDDYIPKKTYHSSRLPLGYAFRDSFSMKDVFIDSIQTLKGVGFDYKEFEPVAANKIHQGKARDRRLGAGLRYSERGTQKYWVGGTNGEGTSRQVNYNSIDNSNTPIQAHMNRRYNFIDDLVKLEFDDISNAEERLYTESRRLPYGDYNYPNIDVSREEETRLRRDIENQVLANKSSAASRLLSPNQSRDIDAEQRGREGVRTRKSLSNINGSIPNIEVNEEHEDDNEDDDNENDTTIAQNHPESYSFSYREPNPWD